MKALLLLFLLLPARAGAEERLPKWEAGAGLGYVRLEHYPASSQYTDLALPFPTFQYRGSILRADDREGARLFFVKRPGWALQLGGFGLAPLTSSNNDARRAMPDLPLLVALGPQFTTKLAERLTFKAGAYQAIAATWLSARGSGSVWESDLTYRRRFELSGTFDETASSVSFNLMGASQEVHELYFGVPAENATAARPEYHAHAGLLQSQLSYFQSFKRDSFAFYVGARVSDYRWSVSRESPLHRSDQNVAALVGFTYTLFRSEQNAVPEEAASGVVDKILRKERGVIPQR